MTQQILEQDDIFHFAKQLRDGDIHIKYDEDTQLSAITVIDSTRRGPALGGCRCLPYPNSTKALKDAVRLAKAMTQKAAAMHLPLGGGKTVIMCPPTIPDRTAFFRTFGRFIHDLGGRYITAVDSGSSLADMDIIASQTPYVASVSTLTEFPTGDPSPFTAVGVFRGIQAAVQHKLGKTSLEGIHVAIQGVGHVGYHLAKLLHEQGAQLTVCDTNAELLATCRNEFNARICAPDDIYSVDCDVFAPCALGAILNPVTIAQISAPIVAGAANNQLASRQDDKLLHERDILYAPDYVLNGGGLIYAHALYSRSSEKDAREKTDNIYDIMSTIFERSRTENRPTGEIADDYALEILERVK